jgi:hypothetical protein
MLKISGGLAFVLWVILTLFGLGHFFIPNDVVLVDSESGMAFLCRTVVNVNRIHVMGSRSITEAAETFYFGAFKPQTRKTYTISEVLFEMEMESAADRALADRADRREKGYYFGPPGGINWNDYGVEVIPFEDILRNRDVPTRASGGWIGHLGETGDVSRGSLQPIATLIDREESYVRERARRCQAVVHFEWFHHGVRKPDTYIVINDGFLIESSL